MPVQVNFYYRDTGRKAEYITIDSALCQHMDIPADDRDFLASWVDYIAFGIAIGHTYETIADKLQPLTDDYSILMLRILHFLNDNYTTDAYRVWK